MQTVTVPLDYLGGLTRAGDSEVRALAHHVDVPGGARGGRVLARGGAGRGRRHRAALLRLRSRPPAAYPPTCCAEAAHTAKLMSWSF